MSRICTECQQTFEPPENLSGGISHRSTCSAACAHTRQVRGLRARGPQAPKVRQRTCVVCREVFDLPWLTGSSQPRRSRRATCSWDCERAWNHKRRTGAWPQNRPVSHEHCDPLQTLHEQLQEMPPAVVLCAALVYKQSGIGAAQRFLARVDATARMPRGVAV